MDIMFIEQVEANLKRIANAETIRKLGFLSYALKLRDALPLLDTSPEIPVVLRPHTAIITARPDLDFERTRKWLDLNNFTDIPLFCRNHKEFNHTLEDKIQSKIKIINAPDKYRRCHNSYAGCRSDHYSGKQ